MAKEGLHYTISAKDQSSKVLRGVLGTISGFSTQATRLLTAPFKMLTSVRWAGLQANVQMLRGLAGQMDALIERGTRLAVVNKSFESLTGRVGPAARRLAREVQEASHGMLTLARSQEIANRALASGLSVPQLKTALDFISRKAVTTGKDVSAALDTVITGLSRGSTLFLDDFGVLVDGAPQVRREFDRIKGSGAFDQLGPAAQKAETVKAAIADMQRQMAAIGITGNEAVFQWARINSSIADSADRLIAAATANKGLQSVLGDVAKVVGGFADALGGPDQHKAITTLWSRMKEGAAAILGDIGELLARPLMEGLGKVGAYFGDLLENAADRLIAKLIVGAKQIPMLAGMIPDAAAQAAAGVLAGARPQMPGLGGGGAPFGRTTAWWQGTVKQFAPMGQDPIEQQNAALNKLLPHQVRRVQADLTASQRRLDRLRKDERFGSTDFLRSAKATWAREAEEHPEILRETAAQKAKRVARYAKEARDDAILKEQARANALRGQLEAVQVPAGMQKRRAAQAAREAQRTDVAHRAVPYYLRDFDLLAPGEVPPLLASVPQMQAAAARVAPLIPASQPAAGWPAPPAPPAVATRPAAAGPLPKIGPGWRPAPFGGRAHLPYDPTGGCRPLRGIGEDWRTTTNLIRRQIGPAAARFWQSSVAMGAGAAAAVPAVAGAAPGATLGGLGAAGKLMTTLIGGRYAGEGVLAGAEMLGRHLDPRLVSGFDWATLGAGWGTAAGAVRGARIGGRMGWLPLLGGAALGAGIGFGAGWLTGGNGGGGGGGQTARDLSTGSQELKLAARAFRNAVRELLNENDHAARELAAVSALV